MNEVILENVRCFRDQISVPLSPITILVGENSTGKSTFLAAIRMAWDISSRTLPIDFNEEPFLLGSFDQIGSYVGGSAGRAKTFTIGGRVHHPSEGFKNVPPLVSENIVSEIKAIFTKIGAQPIIQSWIFSIESFSVKITDDENQSIIITTPSGEEIFEGPAYFNLSKFSAPLFAILNFFYNRKYEDHNQKRNITSEEFDFLSKVYERHLAALGERPYAIAPIRTKPLRTYDPLKEIPKPEGSHVPMTMARDSSSNPEKWENIQSILNNYGLSSGLFKDIVVKRMGRKASDPFQIRVKIFSPTYNLVDVGYGVSQVLPILIDALNVPEGTTILLQQPEVHLHPKAQAELASTLLALAKRLKKNIIIETHSDYLVDRMRMQIRDNEDVHPSDISLLYFERQKYDVAIHKLELDEMGNLINVPDGYRDFFLQEERKLLEG